MSSAQAGKGKGEGTKAQAPTATIPTTDAAAGGATQEAAAEEEPVFKPLKPSVVKAHVLSRRSSFSGLGASPVQVYGVRRAEAAAGTQQVCVIFDIWWACVCGG